MNEFWVDDRHGWPIARISMSSRIVFHPADDRQDERPAHLADRVRDIARLREVMDALQLHIDRLEQRNALLGVENGHKNSAYDTLRANAEAAGLIMEGCLDGSVRLRPRTPPPATSQTESAEPAPKSDDPATS